MIIFKIFLVTFIAKNHFLCDIFSFFIFIKKSRVVFVGVFYVKSIRSNNSKKERNVKIR